MCSLVFVGNVPSAIVEVRLDPIGERRSIHSNRRSTHGQTVVTGTISTR